MGAGKSPGGSPPVDSSGAAAAEGAARGVADDEAAEEAEEEAAEAEAGVGGPAASAASLQSAGSISSRLSISPISLCDPTVEIDSPSESICKGAS